MLSSTLSFSSATTTRLDRAVLMVRQVDQSLPFYQQGLGLNVLRHVEDNFAELEIADGIKLILQQNNTNNEAVLCTGYSPILTFTVMDLNHTIATCIPFGAHLDGPIQYPAHGKVAALRSPDGHMIGLYEEPL